MIAFGAICWGLRSAGSKINKYQKLPQFVSVPEVFTFVAWKCRFQGSKSEIFWVSKFSKISSNLAISKMKDFGNAFYFENYWIPKCLATNDFWRISEDYMFWKIFKSRKNFGRENRIKIVFLTNVRLHNAVQDGATSNSKKITRAKFLLNQSVHGGKRLPPPSSKSL